MNKIQIKCTFCGQQFSVTDSYLGKIVECNTCEKQFEVKGTAIIRQNNYFPDNTPDINKNNYAKSLLIEPNKKQSIPFQTASYEDVSPYYSQTAAPLKVLMLVLGCTFILIIILLFLIGGSEEGSLKDLNNTKRMTLAGFASIAGSGLIIAGSRSPRKGLLISFILGGTLLSMPFFFPLVVKDAQTKAFYHEKELSDQTTPEEASTFAKQLETYKLGIGFKKINSSRIILDNPDSYKAIILRNSKIQDLDTILSYLKYALNLKETPKNYTYGRNINGEPVKLITFISEAPLKQIFEMTKKFGSPQEMNEIRSTLKIIEVIVDRKTLEKQPTKILNDKNHPGFFDANLSELTYIDRDRKIDAIRRLKNIKSKGRQADISTALARLISINDHILSREAISTLYHWTKPEYGTDLQVLNYARKIATTKQMKRSIMEYLADKNIPGSEDVLASQWATPKGYMLWESYLIKAKKRGELAIISALPSVNQTHYKSAASILSSIGTPKSIPFIESILPVANKENQKYLKAAIDEINSRQ